MTFTNKNKLSTSLNKVVKATDSSGEIGEKNENPLRINNINRARGVLPSKKDFRRNFIKHIRRKTFKTQAGLGSFTGILPFGKEIQDVIEQLKILNGSVEKFGENIDFEEIQNNFKNISVLADNLTRQGVPEALTQNLEKISKLLENVNDYSLFILGLLLLFYSFVYTNKDSWSRFCCQMIAGYCLASHPAYVSFLKDNFKNFQQNMAQSGADNLINLITLIWCTFTNKKDFNLEAFSSILQRFHKLTPAFDLFINWFLEFMDILVEQICMYFGYDKPFNFWLNPNHHIEDFIKEAKTIIGKWDGDDLKKCRFVADKLSYLINQGEKLLISTERSSCGTHLLSLYLNELKKIKVYFSENKLLADGLRQEPICILFKGCPGNFKTSTVQHLAMALVSKYLKENASLEEIEAFKANPNDFFYNRQHENEYWEGYNANKIVTFLDDFGQSKDVAGNPDNEYMNLIRMQNEHAMNCHMATLEKKDSTYFTSKFIIATTNLDNIASSSLNCPEAIMRRFDMIYVVVPKPEYSLDSKASPMHNKIDRNSLPNGHLGVSTNKPHLCLSFLKTDKDGAVTQHCSFDQIIDQCFSLFEKKQDWFLQKVFELKETQETHLKGFDTTLLEEFKEEEPNHEFYVDDKYVKLYDELIKCNNKIKHSLLHFITKTGESCSSKFKDVSAMFLKSYLVQYSVKFSVSLKEAIISLAKTGFKFVPEVPFHFFGIHIKESLFESIKNLGTHLESLYQALPDTVKQLSNSLLQWKYWLTLPIVTLCLGLIGTYFYKNSINSSQTNKLENIGMTQTIWDYDPNSVFMVEKIVKKNSYSIELQYKGQSFKKGYVLFLTAQVAIIPYHFFFDFERTVKDVEERDSVKIKLKSNMGENFDHYMDYSEFMFLNHSKTVKHSLKERDIALVYFPYIRSHCDIRSFFSTDLFISKLSRVGCVLVHPSRDIKVDNHTLASKSPTKYADMDGNTWALDKSLFYTLFTTNGDCGSILFNLSRNVTKEKILGIHVAGQVDNGLGFSTIITQEDIKKLLNDMLPEYQFSDDVEPLNIQCNETKFEQFLPIRKMDIYPKPFYITSYKKTKMFGWKGPCSKALSLLHTKVINNQVVDPLYSGLLNYGSSDVIIDERKLRIAADSYLYYLRRMSKFDVPKRILSEEECIKGIDGETYFGSINRQSSMGYPWNCDMHPGFKGKEFIFGKEDEFDMHGPNYLAWKLVVDTKEELLKNNIRPKFYFSDCLKDEKLKLAKVEAGKTRIFSAANFELVYLTRKYFGSFCLWFIKNKINNGSAIGLNPYSEDWNYLARRLMNIGGGSNSTNYGAGDYSKFDGSEKSRVHIAILDIINKWYDDGDDNKRIRRLLWFEVFNSYHVVNGELVMWNNSLPSGHPMTSIINNVYNHIAFRYCWLLLIDSSPKSMDLFEQNVYLITMGDDNLFAVSDTYKSFFNEQTLSVVMPQLGLTYTSDTKDGVNKELRKLTQVTFLKRSFKFTEDLSRWLAPLDLRTILEIPYWCRKQGSEQDLVTVNCDNVIMELSLHGPEFFHSLVKELSTCFYDEYPTGVLRTTDYFIAREIAINSETPWFV